MSHPLKWEFPGGKIENGETPESALIREIKEELSVEIETGQALGSVKFNYPGKSIELIPFLALIKSGEISLTEHQAFRWLQKDELQSLDWAEADIPIIEGLIQLS